MSDKVFLNTEICATCGRITQGSAMSPCSFCRNQMYVLKDINFYGLGYRGEHKEMSDEEIEQLRLDFQPKEKYDPVAWMCREHFEESLRKFGIPEQTRGTKHFYEFATYEPGRIPAQCPNCTSYFTTKVSTGSKMLSIGLFGLASNKVGKQWYCHTCKSYF